MQKSIKTIFRLLAIPVFLSLSLPASEYLNDSKYTDAVNSNNTWRKSWMVAKLDDVPAGLQKFVVSELDSTKNQAADRSVLIPGEILFFSPNGTFNYYKFNVPKCLHVISGTWKVENSLLILKLAGTYANLQDGTEFRYHIDKLVNNETGMELSRTSFPDIAIISKSSDNPMRDMSQILLAADRQVAEKATK